jgi:hypothetical protein
MESSMPESLNPTRRFYWNPERSDPTVTCIKKIRGLAHRKQWNLFQLVGPMSADQLTNWNPAWSKVCLNDNSFIKQNGNFEKIKGR